MFCNLTIINEGPVFFCRIRGNVLFRVGGSLPADAHPVNFVKFAWE